MDYRRRGYFQKQGDQHAGRRDLLFALHRTVIEQKQIQIHRQPVRGLYSEGGVSTSYEVAEKTLLRYFVIAATEIAIHYRKVLIPGEPVSKKSL